MCLSSGFSLKNANPGPFLVPARAHLINVHCCQEKTILIAIDRLKLNMPFMLERGKQRGWIIVDFKHS